jgi:hypothetical protein
MRVMPHKKNNRPREPERDYSHRSLLDKLGIKPGQRIAVLGVEDALFLDDLADRVPEFVHKKPPNGADMILVGAENRKALAQVTSLAGTIHKAGAIWIVYPKGQLHIREADVRAAGKAAGLTDNKVCRFSETHTALRFVIPVNRR